VEALANLLRRGSAGIRDLRRARSSRIPFRAEDGTHLGGTHHLALLNRPAAYDRLRAWLAVPPPSQQRTLEN
jgi:hypothetical protein